MKHKFSRIRSSMLLITGMLALSATGFSQNPSVKVFEDWNTTSGTQNNFQRCIVRSKALGGATYYYTCGSTINSSGNYDILIQKKNASGTILWSQTYAGAGGGNDYGADVQISTTGSVYVCGTYYKDATDSNNAIIIKFNTAGTQQWAYTYNGAGSRHDIFAAMQISTTAIVSVGTTYKGSTNLYDILAARIDTSGNQVWTQTWDYANLNDGAVNLWNSGTRIYIAGGAQSAATTYKYAVVNVKFSDGSIQGATTTGGTAFGFDQLTDIQYDLNGYIYLTGGVINTGTIYDIKTVKLDTALNIIWSATYASSGAYNDVGTGLAIDQVGNVIVTGYRTSATTGQDYVTIKYSSGGTQRWVATYDGGINAQDSATAIVVSPNDTNKIYVTGSTYNGSSKDYWTIKYDGLGNQKWGIAFNNIYNTDDRATGIALDTLGNVIVAGQNKFAWNSHSYTSVKYIEKSVTSPKDTILTHSNSFVFLENRGQLVGTDSTVHPEIKFYTLGGSPQVFFKDTSVSYVFAKLDTSGADTAYRVDMNFVNANQNMRVRPMDLRPDYCNFFMEHIPEGRSRVQNYDELISFNVWNNVDIIYANNLKGMKTYFICKPIGGGGSAYQIDLQYSGADSIRIDASGQLLIYTPEGILVQPKAAAWELDGSGNFASLGWQPSYSFLGPNEVGFSSLGSYTPGNTLVIAVDWGDIQAQFSVGNQDWGTYFGPTTPSGMTSINDNVINNSGQFYVCGFTYSSVFPVLNAYFGTPFGGKDVIVSKFDTDHSMLWSTYYGGALAANGLYTAADEATGIDLDINGNVLVTGFTQSVQLPHFVWGNAYNQTGPGSSTVSSTDAFILRMSSDGQTISWSTWYGGAGEDRPRDIKVCKNTGEIYIAGAAEWDIPILNAPAWSMGGGFLSKFDGSGSHVWATHVGNGSNYLWNGSVNGIAIDANDDVVIVGQTISGTDLPIVNAGGNSTYAGGAYDGFVMKLSATGSSPTVIWSTYYGGGDEDQVCDIVTTKVSGQIKYFIVGITKSSSSTSTIPLVDQGTGNYYQGDLASSGNWDIFIARIKTGGVVEWSTYFGGTNDDASWYIYWSGADIAVNGQGDVFVAFSTNSSDVPIPSPNLSGAYVQAYGYVEAFIAAFRNSTHEYIWGTYFGGSNREWVHSIDCYNNAEVYISGLGDNYNSTFPLESGNGTPYYNPGGNYLNGFIASFGLATVIGVEETSEESLNLGVYPNPTTNSVWISGTGDFVDGLVIEVVNILGEVLSQESLPPSNSINHQIDLSSCAEGVYFIKITSGENVLVRKIEVTK